MVNTTSKATKRISEDDDMVKKECLKSSNQLVDGYVMRMKDEDKGRVKHADDKQVAVIPLKNSAKRVYIFKTQKPGRGSLKSLANMFKDMVGGIGFLIFTFVVELMEYIFGWIPGLKNQKFIQVLLPFLPIFCMSFFAYFPDVVRKSMFLDWLIPEWFEPDTKLIGLGFGMYYILLTGYVSTVRSCMTKVN